MNKKEEMQIIGEITDSPTIFIDGMRGISITNEVAKINLFQVIQDLNEESAPPRTMIVARLAMSVGTLNQIITWLSEEVKTTITKRD